MRTFKLVSSFFGVLAVSLSAATTCSLQAQTLQLPTFSFFSVGTTVNVPDQGSALLGGINRESSGRSEFGVPGLPFAPFRNVSTGQTSSSSTVHASVTIHDFDAMDQAILMGGGGLIGAGGDRPFFVGNSIGAGLSVPNTVPFIGGQPRPTAIAQHWEPTSAVEVPHTDLATAQAERAQRRTARTAEAEDYFERGQTAEAEGKPAVAKVYYQMAARRADGDLKQQVLARLEVVGGGPTRLAGSSQ
jgi:hypothetical protein